LKQSKKGSPKRASKRPSETVRRYVVQCSDMQVQVYGLYTREEARDQVRSLNEADGFTCFHKIMQVIAESGEDRKQHEVNLPPRKERAIGN